MFNRRMENNMKVTSVLETCLYADDLAEAEHFYTDVLGLVVYARQLDRHVFFRCGTQMVLIFNARVTSQEKPAPGSSAPTSHGAVGPGHCAFAVRNDELQDWRDWLRLKNVPIDSEVAWPNGGISIYFRDPAGNHLEVATRKLWEIPEPA